MSLDYRKARNYPKVDPAAGRKLRTMALMFLGSFLVIPLFAWQGYIMEAACRTALGEETTLPGWTEWKAYTKLALRAHLLLLAYTGMGMLPLILASQAEGR